MSKYEDVAEFLRSPDADGLSNRDLAAKFECGEATVRRAKQVLDAERAVQEAAGKGSTEAERLLSTILAAAQYEATIEASIDDLAGELKELKKLRKQAAFGRREAAQTAIESYPLFERIGDSSKSGEASAPLALASVG